MRTLVIIEVDCDSDGFFHFVYTMEVHAHKQFILNDAIYTLGNGIVFRVAAFGHADTYSARPEFAGIGIAGILHTSIRVVYDVMDSVLVKAPHCHIKCFYGKLRLQSVADTPADYLLCLIVGHKGQVAELVLT